MRLTRAADVATDDYDYRRVDGRGAGGVAECHLLAIADATEAQGEGYASVFVQGHVSGADRNTIRSR